MKDLTLFVSWGLFFPSGMRMEGFLCLHEIWRRTWGGGSIPHSLASPPHSVIQVAFDPVTFAWLTLARHIHHVWEQKSFCDFPMDHKREKCEHKCTRKTGKKKKSLAGKPSWQVSIFPRFVPATRLAISFCYVSPSLPLSLFSATVLSLPLSHFVSHCPSGTSLGKKEMQICSDASRTKN